MHTVKRNIDIIITLLVIILLVHPIFEHYPLHFEEYSQAILTAKLFVKNNFNFFSFFFL